MCVFYKRFAAVYRSRARSLTHKTQGMSREKSALIKERTIGYQNLSERTHPLITELQYARA